MALLGKQANTGTEPVARKGAGALRPPPDELVGLIRKLRWIGEDAEAEKLEHEFCGSTRLDTQDPVLYETD